MWEKNCSEIKSSKWHTNSIKNACIASKYYHFHKFGTVLWYYKAEDYWTCEFGVKRFVIFETHLHHFYRPDKGTSKCCRYQQCMQGLRRGNHNVLSNFPYLHFHLRSTGCSQCQYLLPFVLLDVQLLFLIAQQTSKQTERMENSIFADLEIFNLFLISSFICGGCNTVQIFCRNFLRNISAWWRFFIELLPIKHVVLHNLYIYRHCWSKTIFFFLILATFIDDMFLFTVYVARNRIVWIQILFCWNSPNRGWLQQIGYSLKYYLEIMSLVWFPL